MTTIKITQEIIDYINENKTNFSEIQPFPILGEEWIVKDTKTYPNVNNGNPVIEAERKDGCFIRLPEDIVSVCTVDNENNAFSINKY